MVIICRVKLYFSKKKKKKKKRKRKEIRRDAGSVETRKPWWAAWAFFQRLPPLDVQCPLQQTSIGSWDAVTLHPTRGHSSPPESLTGTFQLPELLRFSFYVSAEKNF